MNEYPEMYISKIIENLIHIHPLLSKGITRSIRTKTNLNPGSLYIIGLLSKYEMLSMSEIGSKLSMPKPHVTAHIDKLITEGMVERILDTNDRRIIHIRLTAKGRKDFETIKMELSQELRQRITELSTDKLNELYNSSNQVREILTEIMQDSIIF